MKFCFFKVLSVLLSLVLIINLLPLQILAQEMQFSENAHSTRDSLQEEEALNLDNQNDSENTQTADRAAIALEIIEKRTEFSKEYRLSNGLNLAVVYPESVHYREAGQWKDIDNTLQSIGSGNSAYYRTKAGAWHAEFPQQMNRNTQVRVSRDGYILEFSLAGEMRSLGNAGIGSLDITTFASPGTSGQFAVSDVQATRGQVHELDYTKEKEQASHPEAVRDKIRSRLSYSDVYANTDIVYDVNPYQVKESIVINQYDSALQGYLFILDTGAMTPVLNEDGSIALTTSGGEIIMTMPAPFMVDNAGVVNTDVTVMLEQKGNGYILAYQMPTEWLAAEDRSWPVILDPVVEPGTSTSNILDHYVAENATPSNSSGALYCGHHATYGDMRIFIKFSNLPTFTSDDVIVNANLTFDYLGGSSNTTLIEAHKVEADWATSTLTWANQPAYDAIIEDFRNVGSASEYSWDITDVARGWYETNNTGVMFKASDDIEASTTVNWKKFYSVDYDRYSPEIWPRLEITYQSVSGLEDYWDYTISSAGRAGTGFVNIFTGGLTWVHSDLGFDGNRMPVSISHVYNSGDCSNNAFGLGYGWRTNFHQTIEFTENQNAYIWTDGDGTKHYFVQNNGAWVDQSGLQLTLSISNNDYTITDKYSNTSTFDSSGRLTKLSNNQATQSRIEITYSGTTKRIAQITDGAGRLYKFTYNGSNLLTKIGYHGKNGPSGTELTHVSFAYSSNKLTTITYADATVSCFSYSGNQLISAADAASYKIQYTYTSGSVKTVKQITEISNNGSGDSVSIARGTRFAKITGPGSNTNVLQFNSWGNVIAIQDSLRRSQLAKYAVHDYCEIEENASANYNQLLEHTKVLSTTANYIPDSSFEGSTLWTVGDSNSTRYLSSSAYAGSYSMLVKGTTTNATGTVRGPGISVAQGQTVTFSAYVKTSSSNQAQIALVSSVEVLAESESFTSAGSFTRVQVSYTHAEDTEVTIYPSIIAAAGGNVYVDCVQLEYAATASAYNYIQNGIFATSGNWITTGCTSNDQIVDITTVPAHDGNYLQSVPFDVNNSVFRITGDPNTNKYISQTIPIAGTAGDYLVFSGWALADAAPLTENRTFGLRILFNTAAGAVEGSSASFNPAISGDEWQFTACYAAAPSDYTSVTVQILYGYEVNAAYFDGMQLIKERPITEYEYYDSGLLKKVTDIDGKTTQYTYSGNDLITLTAPDGTVTRYTYDGHHNVATITTPDGVVCALTYDTYGNNTGTRIENGSTPIVTSATYTEDGNLLQSTTNSAGQTTHYGYNEDTGLLIWVREPGETASTQTVYTYDEMYRLTNTSDGSTGSAQYSYGDGFLSTLTNGRTTYTFVYDSFGMCNDISIGDHVLAHYTYSDNNHWLTCLDYGNGHHVEYQYDNTGRLIGEFYNGGTSSTYSYNSSGQLASSIHQSFVARYYYDPVGRLERIAEYLGQFKHTVEYTYNDVNSISTWTQRINDDVYTTCYTYDSGNRVVTVNNDSTGKTYTYDASGRVTSQSSLLGTTVKLTEAFTYATITLANGSTVSTNRVSSIHLTSPGISRQLFYYYDAKGNITSIRDNAGILVSYLYDDAGQLTRENNAEAGKTWVWTYDSAGNILSKTERPYTLGTVSGDPTITYTYGDSDWGDLLTSYNGISLAPDAIGNPTTNGTWNFNWSRGRELTSMSNDLETWIFGYSADGLRVSRTKDVVLEVGSTTRMDTTKHNYFYVDGLLTQDTIVFTSKTYTDYVPITPAAYAATPAAVTETTYQQTLHFSYDAGGRPLSLRYTDRDGVVSEYFYVLNLQGDVIALLNSSGVPVVFYTYDAWGKVLSIEGSQANSIGELNPLRYRGYYYDDETGLYYLQSRYYDPAWGRFLNADSYISTGQGILGNNMFAYCNNNPVNNADPSGEFGQGVGVQFRQTYYGDSIPMGGGGGMATVAAVGAGLIAIGAACCTYVLDFFSGLVRSVLNFFGTSVVKSVSVEDELNDIAGSFGEYRCKEAAQSMADYLTQNGHKAQIVEITFWGGRGYVWSDIAQRTISENGTHVGVLFNGLVFCNVHPYGLPEATWIADFHGTGTKQVVKIPIG